MVTGSAISQYPEIADYSFVEQLVWDIHRRQQDFDEGDLLNRLQRFDRYVLQHLPVADISLDEFDGCDDKMVEYAAMGIDTMPPIVWDAIEGSMIDGIHRANAAHEQGKTAILAYVGLPEHVDPYWVPQDELNDDISDDEDGEEDEENE